MHAADYVVFCIQYVLIYLYLHVWRCAMALVHQRIRRIFFALPNPNAGALGSVYRLQGEKSLNHHYSVFRILIPEQDLNRVELNVSDNFLLHGWNPSGHRTLKLYCSLVSINHSSVNLQTISFTSWLVFTKVLIKHYNQIGFCLEEL